LEEERRLRQLEMEEQQRKIREQEAEERRKIEQERELLRQQIEEEKRKMEQAVKQKLMQEEEAARKEKEEKEKKALLMKQMAEDLARQEEERLKAEKQNQEKRKMQQQLLEAEEQLMKEKKKIEEIESERQILEMEKELEEEKMKLENFFAELEKTAAAEPVAKSNSKPSTTTTNAPASTDNNNKSSDPVPPPNNNRRRLSTFIDQLDLPAPPSAPPKTTAPPTKAQSKPGMPSAAAIPPPNLPKPPPVATGAVNFPAAASIPFKIPPPVALPPKLPPSAAGGLPPPPIAGAAKFAAIPPPSIALPPPPIALPPPPIAAGAKFAAIPPPSIALPPPPIAAGGGAVNLPPPASIPAYPKSRVGLTSKAEAEATLNKLGQKTDDCFNKFLQAGRERRLNEFIDYMKETAACVKEILAVASNTDSAPNLQARLSQMMNALSSSLKTLLLSAKNLANAIEQNQQTAQLLITLEKIASEVLVIKYDMLDYLSSNSPSFFGFKDEQKVIYQQWTVTIADHADNITVSIKSLANVARSGATNQYQSAAAEVIAQASDLRSFINEMIMKATDFTFKQTLNHLVMQLSDALTLLIQSSNNAVKYNGSDYVNQMVNCAVKLARITKETHSALEAKLA